MVNGDSHLQLRPAVVRRVRRNLIVEVAGSGDDRILVADPTGNVELLLEVLATRGGSRADIIRELTSRLDGVEAPAVSAALDSLDRLGLIASPCGSTQTDRDIPGVSPCVEGGLVPVLG